MAVVQVNMVYIADQWNKDGDCDDIVSLDIDEGCIESCEPFS